MRTTLAVWIAQGFGIGRVPLAPGTFGSLLGLIWFLVLISAGSLWLLVAGIISGVLLSVRACGEAERALKQKDPGSVVLDEIVAVPLCFGVWVGAYLSTHGMLPAPAHFWDAWPVTLGVFAAFRFFDVIKPWPVRQSQSLSGGWGVTMDDLLAALYVNATLLVALNADFIANRTIRLPPH